MVHRVGSDLKTQPLGNVATDRVGSARSAVNEHRPRWELLQHLLDRSLL